MESHKLKFIDNWVVLKDSGCLICMLFWKFSCIQNPLCGESDGLGKFCVEILPQYALRQFMDCLQPSLLGTSDVFIVYQIWLHNSTWFIKTLCMQPTFFLPNVFTMQLNKAACKSSDCIGMCYMKTQLWDQSNNCKPGESENQILLSKVL
jgi:hypothetical protein